MSGGVPHRLSCYAFSLVSFCSSFFGFCNPCFSLDSQNPGNTVGVIEDAPRRASSVVQASISQVSSGSILPQEKLKLAFKLLGVSSRIFRVLGYRSSSVY